MNAMIAETAQEPVTETAFLLTSVVKSLVDYPAEASVGVIQGGQSVIFEVAVHREDVRRIIGRRGRTAVAIRELMHNLGSKVGRRYILEIVEPPGQTMRAKVVHRSKE